MSTPSYATVTGVSTPAADPSELSAENLAAAQVVCDAAAAAADLDGPDELSDHYAGAVNQTAPVLKSGPTEVGTETDRTLTSDKTPGTSATYTPAHKDILGDPYRNGGSVNMFGIQESVGGYYSSSTYDFTADFTTTYTISYTCDISKEVYHAAVHIEGDHHDAVHHDRTGHWVVSPDAHGDEEANTNNCNAFNSSLPAGPPQGGLTQANCLYVVETEAYDDPAYDDPDIDIPAYWDAPVPVGNVAGGSFDQTQTDPLDGHEDNGAGYFDAATVIIGQVVVCISPTTGTAKKPGAWTAKNGYTGTKCNSAWYNGTSPYSPSNYAGTNIPNLNDGSHNWVTVPVI